MIGHLRVAALVFVMIVLAGCGARDGAPAKTMEKTYDIEGKVVAIDPDRKKVTLDHKDIPGLMKGMKMPFTVVDANLLGDLKSGDEVSGRLRVRSGEYEITELRKR